VSSLGGGPRQEEAQSRARDGGSAGSARGAPLYAALDLGTNNCRLLVARPAGYLAPTGAEGLRVVDAYSRIVRLGEGLSQTGRLGEPAIQRTLEALDICRDKMDRRGVTKARLIATEACRAASNGAEFVERVYERTGLSLEIIDRETEARLAALGCGSLADPQAEGVLLFDIGGGSTEIVWLAPDRARKQGARSVTIWTSIELGVVSLAERFGGHVVDDNTFEDMVAAFDEKLRPFTKKAMEQRACGRFHLLGTSGTVITLDYNVLRKAVLVLRAVNHKLRQSIINLLEENKRMTVTEIYVKLRLEQSVASQHLAILRRAGVVNTERQGKFIFYSLNHDRIAEISGLVEDLTK